MILALLVLVRSIQKAHGMPKIIKSSRKAEAVEEEEFVPSPPGVQLPPRQSDAPAHVNPLGQSPAVSTRHPVAEDYCTAITEELRIYKMCALLHLWNAYFSSFSPLRQNGPLESLFFLFFAVTFFYISSGIFLLIVRVF